MENNYNSSDLLNKARLELIGISKRFGNVQANDNISLIVKSGEVHGLLGENGAGKTTLMNVVFGLIQADAGKILLDGELVHIQSPRDAIQHRIGMVHQHFTLVPTLTVAENIVLGYYPLFSKMPRMNAVEDEVVRLGSKFGLHINPSALVSSLSVGEQQRVEIIKALFRGVGLLILDEPTAVLIPQETSQLFDTLKTLVHQGLSIIFITHKLNEVMSIANRVSVMRDGRLISTLPIETTSQKELATMMVGRDINFSIQKTESTVGNTILSVENVTLRDHRERPLLDHVSFEIRAGEIFGIAGVDGNGQAQLSQVITGLRKPNVGRINFNGRDITGKSPQDLVHTGLGHIPEDRHKTGLILDFSVALNSILQTYGDPPFCRLGFLDLKKIEKYACEIVSKYDIRTHSVHTRAIHLSGGNQQKIILGREIDRKPLLLVANQPTRGLDVGSTEYIHRLLLDQRARGAAILLISTELEEILGMSDRIGVMYEGRMMGIVPGGRINILNIGLMMAGQNIGLEA